MKDWIQKLIFSAIFPQFYPKKGLFHLAETFQTYYNIFPTQGEEKNVNTFHNCLSKRIE